MKKRIVFMFVFCFILLNSKLNKASNKDYFNMNSRYLSQISGISIEEIEEGKKQDPINFNDNFSSLLLSIEEMKKEDKKVRPFSKKSVMNLSKNDQWKKIQDNTLMGDVYVTKDNKLLYYNYGHTAIAKNKDYVIEHPGKNSKSKVNSSLDTWYGCNTFRLKRYPSRRIANRALRYAERNLLNKSYHVFANRYNKDVLNCATLVFQAYFYGTGVSLVPGKWATLTPKEIENSNKLNTVISFSWDNYSWN